MRSLFSRLVRDERGATAIEYGLIAALVSVAAIAALTALGGSLQQIFQFVANTLSAAAPAAPAPAPAPAP
jgi:pilus assembly protein Flp/PilA